MTPQDEETPIDQEIVNEVVALIPETWDRAVLEVEYSSDGLGEGFDHVIYSPDGHRDLVEPSDLIYDATFRLQQLFRKYGASWNKVRYEITIDDEGVQYKAQFDPSPA
jgi:hypothetical protein